jgi:hypothetical protein
MTNKQIVGIMTFTLAFMLIGTFAYADGNLADDYFELIGTTAFRIVRGSEAPPNEVYIPAYRLHNGDYLPITEIGRPTIESGTRPTFSGRTNITAVHIPDTVIAIGPSAFSMCTKLTSIAIPKSVVSMDYRSFAQCTGLIDITVDKDNPNFTSENGVLYNKTKTEIIIFPANNSIIFIPTSVTSIGRNAFNFNSHIVNLTIPEDVTSIDTQAFAFCKNLTSVIIHGRVAYIGLLAFQDTNITSVTFQDIIPTIKYQGLTQGITLEFSFSRSITDISFPGDLHDKYDAGGPGTYTRDITSNIWTKQ